MSQNDKPNRGKVSQPALFDLPPADVQPREREKVAQLIAAGKSAQAVDFAKEIHKRSHSAASETLLLEAYGARLASLLERGLEKEANALIDLARERYPSAGERLKEWSALAAARQGDPNALLEPLNNPSAGAEKHAEIGRAHV